MNERDSSTTEMIATQQQLFKIEHTVSSRPGSLVEQHEASPSTIEPNPAQLDMFGVEYFR